MSPFRRRLRLPSAAARSRGRSTPTRGSTCSSARRWAGWNCPAATASWPGGCSRRRRPSASTPSRTPSMRGSRGRAVWRSRGGRPGRQTADGDDSAQPTEKPTGASTRGLVEDGGTASWRALARLISFAAPHAGMAIARRPALAGQHGRGARAPVPHDAAGRRRADSASGRQGHPLLAGVVVSRRAACRGRRRVAALVGADRGCSPG